MQPHARRTLLRFLLLVFCCLTRNNIVTYALQESSVDPLGLLRDTKLQHSLPLASAYAALLDHPPTTEQLKRQRSRVDPTHREPLFTNLNRCAAC
jgi:hypothetical protein